MNNKLLRYVKIVGGVTLTSISMRFFLIPNNMVLGGISGLTVVLHYITGLPAGALLFLLNLPLFILALCVLGKDYLLHAFLGITLASIIVDLLAFIPFVATTDPFLIAIGSAVLIGFGAGLIISAKASAGGFDMLARVIHKKHPSLSFSKMILFFDFIVVAVGIFVFRDFERALYAFFTIFLLIQILEFVLSSERRGKICYISTEKAEEIKQAISEKYAGRNTPIHVQVLQRASGEHTLLCSVKRKADLIEIKRIVSKVDPLAFLIITNANEILGQHFLTLDSI